MIRGVNCFWSRLENEEFTCVAVLGPFKVHRSGPAGQLGIVSFDHASPARQFQHFIIAKTKTLTLSIDNIASASSFTVEPIDHFDFLGPETSTDDWTRSGCECWFEDDPL